MRFLIIAIYCFIPFYVFAQDSNPIDISSQTNMGFLDKHDGDGTGGWTDQGPDNDLRAIKSGDFTAYNIKFDIIDPAENNNKSCIVLGPESKFFPQKVSIPLKNAQYKNLYFLQAIAWAPLSKKQIGTIHVTYKDKTTMKIPVNAWVDVANWWNPSSLKNAIVAWRAQNGEAFVGLYVSKFKVENKPIAAITLESLSNTVWMTVGITGSKEDIALPEASKTPVYIVKNKQWQEYEHDLYIEKNSIMDFSSRQDKPAGKYGHVIVSENGHFIFTDAPDKRIRFYGTNMVMSSSFISHERAEELAARLAALGYNSVRIHHYDEILIKKNSPSKTELDPLQLDKLDYLIYCLKKQGIYITTDLYNMRRIPYLKKKYKTSFKFSAYAKKDSVKNWKKFAENWLTHVNPYTKTTLAQDPVLATIGLSNENSLTPEHINKIYPDEYKQWCHLNRYNQKDSKNIRKFINYLGEESFRKKSAFLRKLGVKCPITDQNNSPDLNVSFVRKNFDYCDMHSYWHHPQFGKNSWTLPSTFANVSDIKSWASAPIWMARIFNKPMMITEYNYCYPADYRVDAGVLIGAYGALQDIDGIYQFAYSHHHARLKKLDAPSYFDMTIDPVVGMTQKIIAVLFAREDVSPSKVAFPFLVGSHYLDRKNPKTLPKSYRKLGLIGRIGLVHIDDSKKASKAMFPAGTKAIFGVESYLRSAYLPFKIFYPTEGAYQELVGGGFITSEELDKENSVFRSSTGEITLDQKNGSCLVVTPRTEACVIPGGKSFDGKISKIRSNSAYATFMISSADNNELKKSQRILIIHITNVLGSRTKFGNKERTLLLERGQLPYLIKKGTAKITLSGNYKGFKLYAVRFSGKRIGEIPFEISNNSLKFKADTHALKGGVAAYELIKED